MKTTLLFAAVLFIPPLSVPGEDVFINLPKHMAVGAFQVAAGKIAVTIYEVSDSEKNGARARPAAHRGLAGPMI